MRAFKILLYYLSVLAFGILVFLFLFLRTSGTEAKIIGTWDEKKWEYDKVESSSSKLESAAMLPEYTKVKLKENLIIHEAEKWTFLKDYKLILKGENYKEEVDWIIKGRGNILILRHNDGSEEQYTIDKLTDNSMVISFYTVSQTRAIAKLSFSKINTNNVK